MNVGTKSLLFGVHQVCWHPITVWRAWHHLYGCPTWRECVCILIHDLGYWGCPNMDGREGMLHPYRGAAIAGCLFGPKYHDLVLGHSRYLAEKRGVRPSKLCWADKLSMVYEPRWFYLVRARLSGEIHEYREKAHDRGFIPLMAKHRAWHRKLVELLQGMAVIEAAKEAQAAGRPGQVEFMGQTYAQLEEAPRDGYYDGCVILRNDGRTGRTRPPIDHPQLFQLVYATQLHRMKWRRPR